jgi:ribonuclease HI
LEQEARDEAGTRIYSNGSCQDGSMGTLAVLYKVQNRVISTLDRILRCCLRLDTKYSIWDAEAAGVIMALWLLKKYKRLSHSSASLFSDSQAFIRSVGAQRAAPGFHLVKEFTNLAEKLTCWEGSTT